MEIKSKYHWDTHYPVAELIACLGFFLVFFIEEMVLFCIKRRGGNADHGPTITHVHHHFGSSCHELDGVVDGHAHHNGGTNDAKSTPIDGPNVSSRLSSGRAGAGGGSVGSGTPGRAPALDCAVNNNKHRTSSVASTGTAVVGADHGGVSSVDLADEKAKLNGTGPSGTEQPCMTTASPCCGELFHQEFEHSSGTTEVCHVVHAEPECCEEPCTDRQCDIPPIKMGYKPHAHHHGVRSVTLVLALSIHSVFEGLAFGIQGNSQDVALLFTSIMLHKCVVAFGVGVQLARTHSHSIKWIVISVVVLALMSPLGAAVGIGVEGIQSEGKDVVLMAFEGLCVGTFIYVTFFEVFAHERDNEHPNMLKLLLIMVGFGIIAALRTMDHGHSHGGGHGHGHENSTTPHADLDDHSGHDHDHHGHSH